MTTVRESATDNPRKLPYELIKSITNNFSQDQELGRGAFGQVFKGVLEDGEEVAVKMLRFMGNTNDQQFENEFDILKRLKHPNIVRLVGFCNEAKEELVEYNGKLIVCQRIHRALCLEYMPKGSLGKLLNGENLGKNWPICYKIIKGICRGLEYLQEGLEFPIFHFDLKPDNILLNEEMMPKISDFGLSRLIGEENTKKTLTPLGTRGHLPPEFINYQVISKEYDIYSLGVIITKIITGITGYSDVADMGAQEFVEHVHENWKKCLQEIPMYASLEVDCYQVKRCIVIARRCMENDRHKRPIIKDIVSDLDEMGNFKLDSQLPLENVSLLPIRKEKETEKEKGQQSRDWLSTGTGRCLLGWIAGWHLPRCESNIP
ncbi:cysteine-rich receptor-like protein kinase 25 isoform X1 [Miscanthus floridulus]|uniref:cysteine-rich receptor-like protein kinase 25 isoform X1 n=1 Tax=Miscanthus floridulus TaxID=154761 RepID=UPI00345AAD3A